MSDSPASAVRWIDADCLAALSAAARGTPRRRQNLNFHQRDDALAHRLLNAIEPESYIPPHRHLDPNKDETIIVLRGRLGVVVFTDDGSIAQTAVLSPDGPQLGVDIPHGVFHSLVALTSGCVMFEAKAGPYLPSSAAERAAWAPAEGDAGAAAYLELLRRRFT